MSPRSLIRIVIVNLLFPLLAACMGAQTFTPATRAGDTVALAVGWQLNLSRQNLTVTITPSSGSPVVYPPNDERVRAIINLYPDPSSGVVIGSQTNQNLGNDDAALGRNINNIVTSGDREWWQTMILLDLPASLPPGPATISMTDSAGASIRDSGVEVLPGTGNTNLFKIYYPWQGSGTYDFLTTYPNALKAMERTTRYAVTFNTYLDADGFDVIPHSVQLELTRASGIGVPWVVNARGDIKNVLWSDDGINMKVMVTPTRGRPFAKIAGISQLKFYIAGGVTGLTLTNLKAYDINGSLMTGITANIQQQ